MFLFFVLAISLGFCILFMMSLLYSNLQRSQDVSCPQGEEPIITMTSFKSPIMEFREAYDSCRLKRFV